MLLYYISIPFIYLVAWLPFRLLYMLSDLLFFIVYRVVGYRRKVVRQNLINSFPEKSTEEINRIEKGFYEFFCDLTLETFKTLTISREEALRRCTFKDHSLFDRLYNENRNVIIVMGHYGNWEWGGNSMTLTCNYQLYVIYRPLANKKFNDLIVKMRTRHGTKLYAFNSTLREMLANRNTRNATAFIAASPSGVHVGQNGEQLKGVMKQGFDYYRQIGTKDMLLGTVSITLIDEYHCLANVEWTAIYSRDENSDISINFQVHYLMQQINF